jgi:nucleotide-binding universal stress UspA family protein
LNFKARQQHVTHNLKGNPVYQQILCPIDGSPTSQRGLQEAINLAKNQGAKLRLVHIVDAHFAAMDMYGSVNLGEVIDILRQSGTRILDDASAAASKIGLNVEALLLDSLVGRIGEVIVRQAQEWPADLIVMGTHGRRGASLLFMGSDAETVVRTSTVPVLLVRSEGTATTV